MNKSLKVLALFLAVMMCISVMPLTVFAATNTKGVTFAAALNTPTLTPSASAQQVVMTVKANKAFSVDAIGMTVLIPTGWTLASIENEDLSFAASNVNLANGKVNYATSDADNWTTDLVAKVTYNVPAGASAGTYTLGIKEITISEDYGTEWESDGSASVTLTIGAVAKTLTSIAVTKAPTKTAYTAGENFDPAGMEVTATYSDSTTAKVTGFTVTDGTALTAGKTTVTVSYTEGGVVKTATQAITVKAPAPTTYTVSFDANGGTGTMTAATVASGAEYTLPANGFTAPDGKQFKAWSVDGAEKAAGAKITVTANTTVKAVWESILYTVSFDANGGTGTMTAATVASGAEYTLPANGFTAPDGKQFKAWSVDGAEKAVGDKITVTANTTVKAVWENIPVVNYTVSFDANGGTGTMAAATVASGAEYTLPANGFTAPAGKQFKAWSVDGAEKAVGAKITVTANTTVKAVWESILYTVSFDANGGTGTMTAATVASGAEYTLPENGFTAPDGKQFKAWSVDGAEKAVGAKITVTANTTVKAVWESILYTVSFDANGGTGTMAAATVESGAEYTLPENGFTAPAGKQFKAWSVDGAEKAVGAKITVVATTTVMAVWEDIPVVNYTVSFDANGGTGTMAAATVASGAEYTLPENGFTAPAGKQFKAWSVDGAEKAVGAKITVTANTTVKAVWESILYTVSFDANGGTGTMTAATVASGAEYTLPANGFTAPAGKQFKAWSVDAAEKAVGAKITVTANTTVKAVWESILYTVSFDANGGTGTMTAATVESGKEYTLPANGFTAPAGKQFKAWSVDAAEKAVGDKITVVATTTVMAVWEDIPVVNYTVSFDANGGTGTMTAATVESGAEYTLPANGFTAPDGKQFKAWSVDGAEKAVGAKITVTANTTVKAVWEDIPPVVVNYTVTFDANGGSGFMPSKTVVSGTTLTLPENGFTAPAGHQFVAWNVNGTVAAPGTKITVTANTLVAAVWEAVSAPSVSDDWYWMLIMLYNQKYDITATATEGGAITPAGVTKVKFSKNITYTITPAAGYAVKSVLVDGKDVGAVSTYTFKNVTKKHTIHAIFEAVNPYTDVKKGDWFYEDVLFVTASGLMNGTGSGKFEPAFTTERAMLVTVLWRLEGSPVVKSNVKFDDVKAGQWYTEAINWASANNIVKGYGDGNFGPADPITREQAMAILNRYAAYKNFASAKTTAPTVQYKYSDWAKDNVIWGDNNGLLKGLGVNVTDMTAKASRAELAAYLTRFVKNIVK